MRSPSAGGLPARVTRVTCPLAKAACTTVPYSAQDVLAWCLVMGRVGDLVLGATAGLPPCTATAQEARQRA
jgi:hypothetical protein